MDAILISAVNETVDSQDKRVLFRFSLFRAIFLLDIPEHQRLLNLCVQVREWRYSDCKEQIQGG